MDILIQFDNFCKNEGLYYTLSGGTLLGAIRHKGFIPSTIANMAKMVCEKFGDGKINVELAALKGNYVDKRPAGNFIQYDNGIYHALQECGRVYGEYLHLCKLDSFDGETLQEKEIGTYSVSDMTINSKRNYRRVHTLLAIFDAENIPYVDLHEQRGKLPGKLDRLNNWYQFASAVKKKMKTVKDASQTLFWFGTAETAMPMVGKLKGYNYALTSLELLDDNKTKNRLFSMLTGDAIFQKKSHLGLSGTKFFFYTFHFCSENHLAQQAI